MIYEMNLYESHLLYNYVLLSNFILNIYSDNVSSLICTITQTAILILR